MSKWRVRITFNVETGTFQEVAKLRRKILRFMSKNKLEWLGTNWDPLDGKDAD